MNKKISLLAITSIIALLSIMIIPNTASAVTNEITVTPINEKVSLETTITTLSVPENNTLPWGTVYGSASDIAERYPVIFSSIKETSQYISHKLIPKAMDHTSINSELET